MVDVVNVLNGQEVHHSMQNQPAIQSALKEREAFSFTNVSKETQVSDNQLRVTDKSPKLNLDMIWMPKKKLISTPAVVHSQYLHFSEFDVNNNMLYY